MLAYSEHDVKNQIFNLGMTFGIINFEDFPSESIAGIKFTLRAAEDFFIQYTYTQTKVSKSSFEKNPKATVFKLDPGRNYKHYDLLLGYHILHTEFSTFEQPSIGSVYLVGGIGDTDFGGEKKFSYTAGIGYQIEAFKRTTWSIDYRAYIYDSDLITTRNKTLNRNTQFSTSLNYHF